MSKIKAAKKKKTNVVKLRRKCPHCGCKDGPIQNGGNAICPHCGKYSQA